MSYSLGIDVGTEVVAAALARTGTAAQMVSLGHRAMVAPAVVCVRKDGTVATGEAAEGGPDGAGRQLMSRLGDPTPVVIGGQPYDVTAVLGALLRDVLARVTAAQGAPPDHVVLTRPASWGPFRCALFADAARQAGLTKPGVVTESEAVAAHYAATQGWHDGDTIAVYDLSGGTFNAAVVRKQPDTVQILGKPERIERLDGFDEPAERPEFEDRVRGSIESTIAALSRLLRSADVKPADLRALLLVGGSAGLPVVARMVSAGLGRSVVVHPQPQHVVALGAATLAAQSAALHQRAAPAPARAAAPPPVPAQRIASPPAAAPARNVPARVVTFQGSASLTTAPLLPSPPPLPRPPPAEPAITRPPADSQGRLDRSQPASPAGRAGNQATARRRAPRLLIGSGAAVALTAMIALGVLGSRTSTAVPASQATSPSKAELSAVAKVGPQLATPAVGATIQEQTTPTFVAVTPDGRYAYTANRDAQVITVMDTATNKMTATIPITAGPPQFLSFAPDGQTLYVSLFNDQRTIHAIDVLDTRTNSVVATIPQQARPYLPQVTPDGKQLYVPNHDVASVSVIDTATNSVIGQVQVAPNPHWVSFSSDGRRAYTANHESNLVSVIDTATLQVVKTIPVGTSPHSIAINPHRPMVAEVNYDSNSVSEIDTITDQVVATVPVGKEPQDIAWSPDGRFAYVVNEGGNTVSVIDTDTNQVTATVPTGAGPTSIAMLPDGHRAYVSNLDSGSLTVLELAG